MQQQGGSQYGVPPPEMVPPFSSPMIGIPTGVEYLQQSSSQQVAEAASPINSRPAPPPQPRQQVSIFEEYGSGGGAMVRNFADEEALGAGEELERGGGGGNRWPRQEALALLKIRSDMDAVFRDATLKGPLWEDVSRKLAELGYSRSAKKCKEKFENVHKYYKRTKEGRAGRQDGKSYRFFTQLEALHSSTGGATSVNPFPSPPNTALVPNLTSAAGSAASQHKTSSSSFPIPSNSTMTPPPVVTRTQPPPVASQAPPSQPHLEISTPAAVVGISFSSNTSSSSASESDGENTEEGGLGLLHDGGRKRKREGWPGGSRKMIAFFDGLMKQVMERQETMQQRFLETIEKREQDRMIREEAWKRQEMARLNREYELMAQERTVAANRDAAIISFLQKFTGIQPPISAATPPEESAPPPPTSPVELPKHVLAPVVEAPAMQNEASDNLQIERNDLVLNQATSSSEPAAVMSEMADGVGVGSSLDAISPSSSSSRWPKMEVLALIRLRSGLESRYLESGPKGPLWEEISLGMKRLGYNRNSKRCKEKWENINKYFKKVKESNKKRPEDAKTCPYFHELDALYRKKQIFGGAAAAPPGLAAQQQQQQELAINQKIGESLQPPVQLSVLQEKESHKVQKNPNTLRNSDGGNHESGGVQIPRSNGTGIPQLFFGGPPNRGSSTAMKKPEDIVRELMGQPYLPHRGANDFDNACGGETVDSVTINHEYEDEDEDNDDEDEEDDEEDVKLRYEIQFQRQGVGAAAAGSHGGNSTGKVPTTAAAAAAAASSAGSFLAMVQ